MVNGPLKAFEDDPNEFDAAPPAWLGAWAGARPVVAKVLAGVTVIAILAAAWPFASSWLRKAGDLDVYLRGRGVDHLKEGAWVVIGSQQVGRVGGFEVREGEPVARLQVEGKYRRQIPSTSRFEVSSLNVWVPGRVGVRILCSTQPLKSEPLPDGALVQTANTVLPADVPPRFYLLVAASIAGLIGLSILAKVMKSVAVVVSGVALIVAIIAHLSGLVSVA